MEQTHICSKCSEAKPWAKFQLYKEKPVGQCRECKTKAMKALRVTKGISVRKQSEIIDGTKLCMRCDKFYPLDHFSKATRGLGGLATYCKPCHAEKYRNKDKAKTATATYRIRHRERHLARHRVRMFEYKTHKRVTADGSVTDQLLKHLYAEPRCFYCKQDIVRELRTIDHKTPLSKGGEHVAGNLVMACWACNCSKRDLNEHDFKQRMAFNDSSKNY